MGASRLWWKRFVEKVSFEPGMATLSSLRFSPAACQQSLYGAEPLEAQFWIRLIAMHGRCAVRIRAISSMRQGRMVRYTRV